MGDMNVQNLTPAQRKVFDEQKKLGKSDEEAYKFAVAEGLSGEQEEVGDHTQFSSAKPKEEPKEESFWGKLAMGVAGLGGLALAVLSKGKAAKVGLGIAGIAAAGTLASCSQDDVISQSTVLNLNYKTATPEEIADAIFKKFGGDLLKAIYELKTQLGNDFSKMFDVLANLSGDLKTISELLMEQGAKADVIISKLEEHNNKLDILIDNSVRNTEQGEKLAEILDRIFAAVQEGNKLGGKNNELLTQILGMLGNLQAGDQDKIELLNAILAKLEVLIQKGDQLNENDQKMQVVLEKILAAINRLDGDLRTGVLAILNKMDKMDKNNLDMLTKILEKIEQSGNGKDYTAILNAILAKLNESVDNQNQMGEGIRALLNSILDNIQAFGGDIGNKLAQILKNQKLTNAELEEIRKAILEGNKIAQGTQDMIASLGDLVNRLGAELFARLEQGQLSLDEIKELIAKLRADNNKNAAEINNKLTSIEDKLNFVGAMINNLLTSMPNMHEETKALLLAILAKIPAGCHCESIDLTVIIEKLDQIIKEIQNNPNGNHEGILDDLDDLLS